MKIQDISGQQAIQGDESVKKQQDGARPADAFSALLENELSGLQAGPGPDQVTGSDPALALSGITGILGIGNTTDNSALAQPVSAIEDTLANLDALGQALQGNKTPKEINAIIEKISAQAAGLDDKLGSLPTDHPLKDLGEEVKIAAYTVSVKWNRGDYL
jgi:hypothetical protein